MSKYILPECYADTTIIEVLGYSKPNHIHSIGQVINVLNKNYNGKLGIGFIDRDKARKGDAENTQFEIIKSEFSNTLLLKRKPKTKNYLIEHPNIENWLYYMANDLGVDIQKYGVADLITNTKRYKTQKITKDESFKSFVNALKQKSNSPLETVIKWVEELKKQHGF